MAPSTNHKVGQFALQSRLLVLLMQALFNFLLPDHDAKVFTPPVAHSTNIIDQCVELAFGGFRRWDAIYFLHISEYGYTYENTLAFFPLFPCIVRILANSLFYPLQMIMNYGNVLLVTSYFVNLVCFIKAANYLHDLTIKVMQDKKLAMKVVQLFCVNPASIFFSAAYSESLFAMLSFGGLLRLENGSFMTAAMLFGFSSGTRSNGIINLAFILYKQFKITAGCIQNLFASTKENCISKFVGLVYICCISIAQTTVYSTLVVAPFLMYQYYSYLVFCKGVYSPVPPHLHTYAIQQGHKMPSSFPASWCHQPFPISYSYIQNTYWKVGFLAYYQLTQIPNFVLALPVVIVAFFSIITYIKHRPVYSLTLGLYDPAMENKQKKTDEVDSQAVKFPMYGYNSRLIFVYVAQLAALVTFGMLFMHVQVLTRFVCSSCPVFYFFLAWITIPQDQLNPCLNAEDNTRDSTTTHNGAVATQDGQGNPGGNETFRTFMDWEEHWTSKAVYVYFHLYFFVGVAAFANFLPWT